MANISAKKVIGRIAALICSIGLVGLANCLRTCYLNDLGELVGIILIAFLVAMVCKSTLLPLIISWMVGFYLICLGVLGRDFSLELTGVYGRTAVAMAGDFDWIRAIGIGVIVLAVIATVVHLVKIGKSRKRPGPIMAVTFAAIIIASAAAFCLSKFPSLLVLRNEPDLQQVSAVYRADAQRSGVYASSFQNASAINPIDWTIDSVSPYNGIVVADGTVYVAGFVRASSAVFWAVFAIDAVKHMEMWRYVAEGAFSPVVYEDLLLFRCDRGVIALDRETGKLKWEFRAKETTVLTCVGKTVLFGGRDSSKKECVFAVGVNSGKLQWKYYPDETIPANCSFAADQGVLYLAANYGVYAINIKNGHLKWRVKYEDQPLQLCISHDTNLLFMLFGIPTGICAVDLESGKTKWTKQLEDRIDYGLAVWSDLLFFGCDDGFVYALHCDTGQLEWKESFFQGVLPKDQTEADEEAPYPVYSLPSIADGMLYISGEDLNAIDARTGRLQWKIKNCFALPYSEIIIMDNSLYLLSSAGLCEVR